MLHKIQKIAALKQVRFFQPNVLFVLPLFSMLKIFVSHFQPKFWFMS